MTSLNGATKGALAAAANLFVVALAIGWAESEDRAGAFLMVAFLAAFPALATGLILGIAADLLARRAIVLRLAVLIPPAMAIVGLLGHDYNMDEYILPAAIPTLVGVLVLERWTRVRTPPPVPVARGRMGR